MSGHRPASIIRFVIAVLFIASLSSSQARAQSVNAGKFKIAAVPAPQSVLGFAPGAERTIADWRQITNYFARLDRASDRVTVETIGETTLKRPFIVAFISAPENLRQLNK
ncbi:MAG: hypothetical protein H7Y30_12755, partial [Pyrinomonadaceae bacterium]|nr:hypothetical protein [Pyrinomonadaceae bacterium]